VPHNLISAQESPVPLPKFQMAPRLKILMSSGSKKGTQIYYPFLSQKVPASDSLQVSQRGPYGERFPLTWHFYISLDISLFIVPSESPVRDPPPCSLTGSPWTGILRHQSHWSNSFIHSFIHSFMSVCLSPQQGALLHMGKNIKVTVHGAPCRQRPTYSGARPSSPTELLTTLIYTPVPCSLWHDTFHLGLGRPEAPLASVCHSSPHQGIPSTTVTASHVTQGRVEYESAIP